MATFDDFLAQLKAKKVSESDIPMERPADDSGILTALQSGMPETTQAQRDAASMASPEASAALQSNTKSLGIPSVTFPYRNESDSALPPIGIANGGQLLADESNTPAASEEIVPTDIIKAMKSIVGGSRTLSPAPSPVPTIRSATPTDMSDKEFAAAQELADRRRIGRGIAGLGAGTELTTPKSSLIKGLAESAENPIKDLAAKRKAEKEMLDLMDDKKKNDPQSDVSKLYRDSFKKLGIQIPDTATASELEKAQPAIGMMINRQAQIEANKIAREGIAATRAATVASKADAASQKDAENFRKAYDPQLASSRSGLGKESSRYVQSTHALNLLSGIKDLNDVNPIQQKELAVALATMLSPGLPHEATINSLDPDTLGKTFANLVQKVTGSPHGTNSAGMVAMLKKSVENQQKISAQNIKKSQNAIKASYAQKIKTNPELYGQVMQSIDSENGLDQALTTSQKTPSADQVSQYSSLHGVTPAQANAILTKRLNQ
jgi:hypothetical protein